MMANACLPLATHALAVLLSTAAASAAHTLPYMLPGSNFKQHCFDTAVLAQQLVWHQHIFVNQSTQQCLHA